MTMEHYQEEKENRIEGRNAVLEAIRADRTIERLYVQDGCKDGPVQTILREAKKRGIQVQFADKARLSRLSQTGKHQGVIADAAAYAYAQVEDMLALARERGEDPFLILLDNIEDPHNLGAIIRTANLAEAAGSGAYRHGSQNLRGSFELHAGGPGHQPGEDHGGVKGAGDLVCLRGYGRRAHVPAEPYRSHRPCDRQ